MRYSIIIPTYNKFHEAFKKCLPSVVKYTDLSDAEIIVVCNGSNEETRTFIDAFIGRYYYPIKYLWFDEGLGYAKAVNEGIKISQGEYVILLNDDTILLEQPHNEWIRKLKQPFLEDEKMGLTAPMKTFSPSANHWFLIFFCVMIHRKVIDKIGLLDEAFYSYGEDTSYCIEAEKAGFKIKQVPRDSNEYYEHNRMTGDFQIWHDGNVSHKNWVGGEELIAKNNAILKERYNNKSMVNIENAKNADGYMSEIELRFLGTLARENKIVCECGSWHGRSTRALGDNTSGVVYAIDTWNGSALEKDTNHASAKQMEGDHALYEFYQNNFDLVQQGKVIPMRMSGKNAAKFFKEKGIQFDAVFIDAGHEESEVREDIECWLPLVKDGGTLCGHDYYYDNLIWDGVKKAVDNLLGNITVAPETSIWVYKKDTTTWNWYEKPKPKVFDCFPFLNELDILDIRFAELYDVVDRFIIVEAMQTHSGLPKPLNFQNNLDRYQKYLHKVTYLVIEQLPVGNDDWARERTQRDYIMNGLKDCKDTDIILIGDCDEIPKAEAIKNYKIEQGLTCIQTNLYYYNFNCRAKDKWNWLRILPYGKLKQMSPCEVRYTPNYNPDTDMILDSGWHFSYFASSPEKVIEKIKASPHQEYNKGKFVDAETVKIKMQNGQDLFDRDLKYDLVPIDNSYPKFVIENLETFKKKGLVKE